MSIICSAHSRQCASNIHTNQDKFGCVRVLNPYNKEITLAVVADGISLGFEGKYASYNTILWLLKWASEYLANNDFNVNRIAEEIQAQMVKYNHLLNNYSDMSSDKDTCCTVCGMVTDESQVLIFNAGDSRLYELPYNNQARCMTQDDKAEDGYSIAMHIGGKNDDEIELSFSVDDFHYDSMYILCTDGFYHRCNLDAWRDYIFQCRSREDFVNTITTIADNLVTAGETDDITALILARSG